MGTNHRKALPTPMAQAKGCLRAAAKEADQVKVEQMADTRFAGGRRGYVSDADAREGQQNALMDR